ncbi:MAG: sporulation protein YqfD [Clostridiaceae bacterium]|nr:sporulation protein YqfD [Eubacteriales bacterium]
MLRGIWNSLAGYVIIQMDGLSLERFLNLALQSGVELWNVRRKAPTSMTACVHMEGFYALHKLKRGLRCRIRILEKHGLVMRILPLRLRKVLLFGWVVVLAALLGASRFVWFITVSGCDVIEEQEIIQTLDRLEIHPGTPRAGVRIPELDRAVMASDHRIAWAGSELSGVILRVSIREAGDEPEIVKTSPPASVYASSDGVIVSISAYDGSPKAHVGDAVKKGDLLISANLAAEGAEPRYVRARGEVIAQVHYRFVGTAGPDLEKPVRTGLSFSYTSVSLFGFRLFEPKSGYEMSETETLSSRTLQNLFLPVTFERRACYELHNAPVPASYEELELQAVRMAQQALTERLPRDGKMLFKKTNVKILGNGAVEAVIDVTMEQSIALTIES